MFQLALFMTSFCKCCGLLDLKANHFDASKTWLFQSRSLPTVAPIARSFIWVLFSTSSRWCAWWLAAALFHWLVERVRQVVVTWRCFLPCSELPEIVKCITKTPSIHEQVLENLTVDKVECDEMRESCNIIWVVAEKSSRCERPMIVATKVKCFL